MSCEGQPLSRCDDSNRPGAASPPSPGDSDGQASAEAEAEAEAAHNMLLAYRRKYDAEVARRIRSADILRRPFEALETAFQATAQLMVALVAPSVHPIFHFLSRTLPLRRDYPRVLVVPSLTVVVSALHAKLVLDMANWWGLPPFCWVEPRPAREEILHPLSSHAMELNMLSAAIGVSMGRLMVLSRHGLLALMEFACKQVLPSLQSRIVPMASRVDLVAGVASHAVLSASIAPVVVGELTALLRESQLRGQHLVPTAFQALWKYLRWLWQGTRKAYWEGWGGSTEEGFCGWEGADDDRDVPHDLLCPITGHLFVHPVVLLGMVFEHAAARRWVETTSRHPVLQGMYCVLEDIQPAPDIEALCHRLAAARGWTLRCSSTRTSADES
eukprot:TRINITY_DN15825_c0_g1_i1.p1 TRINITY_DN15825_c0_g1~~TRINITY_DN15825_c0_g1_i1.p1  ORF type:complete len:386 (-),score=57.66 TRINITY_DN15825_c0_g1_i1:55-1212(-)